MCDAGVPLDAVTCPSFQGMINAIGQYGVGVKPPTYYEVRVPFLRKEVTLTQKLMNRHEEEWARNGCSIMFDGWTEKKEKTFAKFLVNCSWGTLFIESIVASSIIKTGEKNVYTAW